jgi:hypothetical protein
VPSARRDRPKGPNIAAGTSAGHDGDCLNALFQGVNEAANELNVHVYTD